MPDSPIELLGRTDRDFHPAVMANAYIAEDRRVMEEGRSLTNQVWFVVDRSGRPGWFNSIKVPLRGECGEVTGLTPGRFRTQFRPPSGKPVRRRTGDPLDR